MNHRIFWMTRVACLSAVASVLFYLELPIALAFYKLDISTMPAILAGFSLGPLAGLTVLVVKDVLHLFSTSTFGVGELADLLISAAYVVPAALIYRRRKNMAGALKAMGLGTLCMCVAGVLTNYFILIPFYVTVMHMPMAAVLEMGKAAVSAVNDLWTLVLFVTLPFNLLKGFALSLVTFLLYKRLSRILHQEARP